jgi:hypothetical protein
LAAPRQGVVRFKAGQHTEHVRRLGLLRVDASRVSRLLQNLSCKVHASGIACAQAPLNLSVEDRHGPEAPHNLYARPVLTRDRRPFEDISANDFTFTGARLERHNLGRGKLSFFAAQLRNDHALYLAASGHERRNIIDAHYAGRGAGWDWDVEAMGQWGSVGDKKIHAWGGGTLFGYTWESGTWSPRLGFQFDAASGTHYSRGTVLATFNPLFPNGFYELLAGYPGYANFVHIRLPAMMHPTRKLSTLFDTGSLWRVTTADAVYLLPAIPALGTAGHGGAYSGTYGQIRLDWKFSQHLTAAFDSEYFAHSQSLQQAGARKGHYIGVELNFGI